MDSIDRAISIDDLRAAAQRRLPDFAFMPMEMGSGNGRGPQRNVAAFERYRLAPRVLINTRSVDQGVSLFGTRYDSPFGISAIGLADRMMPGTDEALAEAAASARIPFILSGGTTTPIERITKLAPGMVWQQLYAARTRSISDAFLGRGADCGCTVLVFTVDLLAPLWIDWLKRAGIALPASIQRRAWLRVIKEVLTHPSWSLAQARAGGLATFEGWRPYAKAGATRIELTDWVFSEMHGGHDWSYVEHVRKLWKGKLVIKGLLRQDDVARAFNLGADAVTVSNHGGNRLDNIVPPLEVLPEIAASRTPGQTVLFDGGIRRGSDILVARALGADLSFVGRAALYGALAGGARGALRAVEILRDEVARTLAHAGCPDVAAFDSSFLVPVAEFTTAV